MAPKKPSFFYPFKETHLELKYKKILRMRNAGGISFTPSFYSLG